MIRFDHVFKQYAGGREALIDLSFEVAPGEMVFLTGHSGAGKTTLLRIVAALERASRGTVTFDGMNITRLPVRRIPAIRRRVGMIFQDHRLLADRSIFDNVALPLVILGMRRSEIRKRVHAALELVGLRTRERSLPQTLSTGEQQRVGIARAIVARPPVVLADEPTGNLDPKLSREIMTLFAALHEVGLSIVIASHDLDLVRRMGKRVLVLEQGKLIDDFRPPSSH